MVSGIPAPLPRRSGDVLEYRMDPLNIRSAPDESRYQSVSAQLRDHAAERGDTPFIVSIDEAAPGGGCRDITFGGLWRLSNRLARYLADRGHRGRRARGRPDRQMPVLYYAIQRYGVAFYTINVEVNASHVREMLARIKPDLVLWQEDLDISEYGGADASWVRFGACDPACLAATDGGLFEGLNAFDDGDSDDNRAPMVDHRPDDLCVLSFTSGTSAAPKGVMHRFGNYYWIANQTIDMWKLTGADRMLEFRSLSWHRRICYT